MVINVYTPQEDRFIIRHCKNLTFAEIALHLGRPSECSIEQRIEILKRRGKLKRSGFVRDGVFHPFYSDEEDETIKKLYSSLGKKVLAKKLKRPESSVRYRAAKLNVKPGPTNHLNPPRIARLLGVCSRIVNDWIYQGFLKADNKSGRRTGRHREWIIKPRDFYRFLKDYYHLYDPDRVRDKFLREIIETTPAGKAVSVFQACKVLGIVRSAVNKKIANGKFPSAYKGFGPSGHNRWYVHLDDSAFHWFHDLVDNNEAAGWITETARLRDPDSIILLNILIKYEPARVWEARRMIRGGLVADGIVRKFEATPEGERLKNLTD